MYTGWGGGGEDTSHTQTQAGYLYSNFFVPLKQKLKVAQNSFRALLPDRTTQNTMLYGNRIAKLS